MRVTAFLIGITATPAFAEIKLDVWTYACDRGVQIPVTFVSDDQAGAVVIHVDGQQIPLLAEGDLAGEEIRYVSPFDRPSHVWVEGPTHASLYWSEAGQEVLLLTCAGIQ